MGEREETWEPSADGGDFASFNKAASSASLGSVVSRPFPLHERESLDMFQPPRDSPTNIEEIFGQLILMMSGMPIKFGDSKLIIRKLQSTSLAFRRLLKGA